VKGRFGYGGFWRGIYIDILFLLLSLLTEWRVFLLIMLPARPQKQSMAELKLRRLTEHNQRLRADLARPRIRVSEASIRWVLAAGVSHSIRGDSMSIRRWLWLMV
jgi:hypothetical protein